MKTMYKASMEYGGMSISEHDVIKETDKYVIYYRSKAAPEVRESKYTHWHKWCDTKEEAKSYLRELCYEEIRKAKEVIKKAELTLSKIEAL